MFSVEVGWQSKSKVVNGEMIVVAFYSLELIAGTAGVVWVGGRNPRIH
jgi:hypothetical protein